MRLLYTRELEDLLFYIDKTYPTFIVLEGYNAVGKSIVTESILDRMNILSYRPDYNLWASRLPREYRWAVFSSFLDIVNRTHIKVENRILFDRGFFSGVVYNNDLSLADFYREMDIQVSVLHILVSCSEEDYNKFLAVRDSDKNLSYEECETYTKRYREAFDRAGVNYVEYQNTFNEKKDYREVCAGCSHYTYHNNSCNNPLALSHQISNVSPTRKRCEYSHVKEVQDEELQSLPS